MFEKWQKTPEEKDEARRERQLKEFLNAPCYRVESGGVPSPDIPHKFLKDDGGAAQRFMKAWDEMFHGEN